MALAGVVGCFITKEYLFVAFKLQQGQLSSYNCLQLKAFITINL
jgi:hypothetical protein